MPTFYFGAAAAVSPGSKIRIMKLATSLPGPNGPGTSFFSGGRLLGVFIAAGILAALAGLLQAGRIASIPSSLGQNLIFNAFAAAVLGGVSLNGGRGRLQVHAAVSCCSSSFRMFSFSLTSRRIGSTRRQAGSFLSPCTSARSAELIGLTDKRP
ncbi:hypothetical protein GGE12_006229 [Rhizobium mongolense]|uniref:Uncharacterized protein n=1 Tax=Rhizobium mongolense TaxID=57676 RepID=A0A7W6RUY1_9HYPH|nr:hypothetical protein [Rhizobium mongolense]